jgi:hypothetical protein
VTQLGNFFPLPSDLVTPCQRVGLWGPWQTIAGTHWQREGMEFTKNGNFSLNFTFDQAIPVPQSGFRSTLSWTA